MHLEKTKKLTTVAILVAMHIILSRFLSYSVWNMKIGFDFLPVAVAAVLLVLETLLLSRRNPRLKRFNIFRE